MKVKIKLKIDQKVTFIVSATQAALSLSVTCARSRLTSPTSYNHIFMTTRSFATSRVAIV